MYHAAASFIVHSSDERALFDLAFNLFWSTGNAWLAVTHGGARTARREADGEARTAEGRAVEEQGPPEPPDTASPEETAVEATYSPIELLHNKDFSAYDDAELALAQRSIDALVWQLSKHATRRREISPKRAEYLDLSRTMRSSLRYDGEIVDLAWQLRKAKPRPAHRSLRYQWVDGSVLAGLPALHLRTRIGAQSPASRGLRIRHAPDAHHARSPSAQRRGGAGPGVSRARVTGPAAPASAKRCASTTFGGPGELSAAARLSSSSATAGIAGTSNCCARRWAACAAVSTGSSGSTHCSARLTTNRSPSAFRPRSPLSTTSCRSTTSPASKPSRWSSANRSCGSRLSARRHLHAETSEVSEIAKV